MSDNTISLDDVDKRARAREAQALKDNRIWRAVIAKLRADTIASWESSGAREAEQRELLWTKIQVLRGLETEITSIVNDGKIEDQKLAEAEKKRGRPANPRL